MDNNKKNSPDSARVQNDGTGKKTTGPADEKVVIQDECGDSLWDLALAQEEQSRIAGEPPKPGASQK